MYIKLYKKIITSVKTISKLIFKFQFHQKRVHDIWMAVRSHPTHPPPPDTPLDALHLNLKKIKRKKSSKSFLHFMFYAVSHTDYATLMWNVKQLKLNLSKKFLTLICITEDALKSKWNV